MNRVRPFLAALLLLAACSGLKPVSDPRESEGSRPAAADEQALLTALPALQQCARHHLYPYIASVLLELAVEGSTVVDAKADEPTQDLPFRTCMLGALRSVRLPVRLPVGSRRLLAWPMDLGLDSLDPGAPVTHAPPAEPWQMAQQRRYLEGVIEALSREMQGYEACRQSSAMEHGGFSRTTRLALTIGPAGGVQDVDVSDVARGMPELSDCVRRRVQAVAFPAPGTWLGVSARMQLLFGPVPGLPDEAMVRGVAGIILEGK